MTKPEKPAQKPADGPDAPDRERRRQAGNARARRVRQAAEAILQERGSIAGHTPRGEVLIESVELRAEDGIEWIEARSAPGTQSGETHFRIFNPPTGVLRPNGDIEEDPIGALCEVLAQFGGAQRVKRRRQR